MIIAVIRNCISPHETPKDAFHFDNGNLVYGGSIIISIKYHSFHQVVMNAAP